MLPAPASPDLVALESMVATYCRRSSSAPDQQMLVTDLLLKRALINRLELDFAQDAARFAATYDEAVHFNPSPVSWMRENCHMTSHAAATAVCVGENAARL